MAILELAIEIAFIAIPFLLIYLLDRRVKRSGALFTGQSSQRTRLLALTLGMVIGGFALFEIWATQSVSWELLLVAIGLFAYSFGAGQLLNRLQRERPTKFGKAEQSSDPSSPAEPNSQNDMGLFSQTPFLRSISRVGLVFVISAGLVFVSFWAMLHPDDPLALKIAIGAITLIGVAIIALFLGSLFKALKNLFK